MLKKACLAMIGIGFVTGTVSGLAGPTIGMGMPMDPHLLLAAHGNLRLNPDMNSMQHVMSLRERHAEQPMIGSNFQEMPNHHEPNSPLFASDSEEMWGEHGTNVPEPETIFNPAADTDLTRFLREKFSELWDFGNRLKNLRQMLRKHPEDQDTAHMFKLTKREFKAKKHQFEGLLSWAESQQPGLQKNPSMMDSSDDSGDYDIFMKRHMHNSPIPGIHVNGPVIHTHNLDSSAQGAPALIAVKPSLVVVHPPPQPAQTTAQQTPPQTQSEQTTQGPKQQQQHQQQQQQQQQQWQPPIQAPPMTQNQQPIIPMEVQNTPQGAVPHVTHTTYTMPPNGNGHAVAVTLPLNGATPAQIHVQSGPNNVHKITIHHNEHPEHPEVTQPQQAQPTPQQPQSAVTQHTVASAQASPQKPTPQQQARSQHQKTEEPQSEPAKDNSAESKASNTPKTHSTPDVKASPKAEASAPKQDTQSPKATEKGKSPKSTSVKPPNAVNSEQKSTVAKNENKSAEAQNN